MRTLLLAAAISSTYASKPKLLCLHGGGQSASSFQADNGMVALEQSLGNAFDFVYVSAPYAGGLWIRDPPQGKGTATTDPDWASQSVALLDDIVANQGPFHGILGYSQGTAMVLTYLASLSAPATDTFDVVMLFCGYVPTSHAGLTSSIDAASPFGGVDALIWMGGQDPIISNALSQAAADEFSSPTVITSATGGHAVPSSSDPTFDSVVHFVRQSVGQPPAAPSPPDAPPDPPTAPLPPGSPPLGSSDGPSMGAMVGIVAAAAVAVAGAVAVVSRPISQKRQLQLPSVMLMSAHSHEPEHSTHDTQLPG